MLPACTSFERSELKIYAQQHAIWTEPAIQPLWESRPDADIIFELARRMEPDDDLMEKGYESCIDWILGPTGLTVDELKKYPAGCRIKNVQPFAFQKYKTRGFSTPSGKMEFASKTLSEFGYDPLPVYTEPGLSPRTSPEIARNFPLQFTTGSRLPMFVHSRTFRLDWTRSLRPDPMVDINAVDAKERKIVQNDWVDLSTPRGAIRVRANITERVPPGVVTMLHGYPEADVNTLIEPDYLDPVSGFPGFKSLLCEIKKSAQEEVR